MRLLATLLFTLLAGLPWSLPAHAVPLTVIGTNDVHGRVERAAALSGHLKILRDKNTAQGGGVVLVDAGDMFQGTLESNLEEGRVIVTAMNHLGYHAAAVGNHEFDFGPAGSLPVPKTAADDARGALKARAKEARFPFLVGNILDQATGLPPNWENFRPAVLVNVAEIPVGVIGLSTMDTPKTTIATNFRGLRMRPLIDSIAEYARGLRDKGARVIVVTAHAGGRCSDCNHPADLSSCGQDEEIMAVARGLPRGLVDVIVAGHTHATMAHDVNGIAVVEAWANGRGFSRVDLDVDAGSGSVRVAAIHPPRGLCGDNKEDADADISACRPADYEGKRVVIDQALLKKIQPALRAASRVRHQKLGVQALDQVRRGYDKESALGNLVADLMRAARPGADVALINGGGIRDDLPPGPLTYGRVFSVFPFDNRFVTLKMSGGELRAVLEANLSAKKGGILHVSGARATVRCAGGHATVVLMRADGKAIADADPLTVVTSDFLVLGGDEHLEKLGGRPETVFDEGEPVREHLVAELKKRGGSLSDNDPTLFDRKAPRLHQPGVAYARCSGP